MTPRELILATAARLRTAGIPDPATDSALMLSALLGKAPLALRLDMETVVPAEAMQRMEQWTGRREAREPLQYILGEAPFCGRMFLIGPGALIPRPETEELCRWGLEKIARISAPLVLDLCSGSGCIGLTIQLERPDAHVTLLDLSADAMAAAEKNRKKFQTEVRMVRGDLFSPLEGEKFDLILSNPPYIPEADCQRLQPEVRFEPLTALNGGADGLDFYRRIAESGKSFLHRGGMLMMELGDGEAEAVRALLLANGWEQPEIRLDMQGKKRMIAAAVS